MATTASGRRIRKRKLKAEINVVPYIDVMLVLLIIFMVTAPLLNLGVDVKLPQVAAASVEQPKQQVVVQVGEDGALSLIQRELNPRLTVAGMILTMHDGRTRLARDVEREVREHFPELVFETVVPRSVRLAEAPSHGLPVTHYDRRSAGAEAYWKVAMELVERS